ncbi:MAG: CocE/NonD family hydrolase [Chloroflexi bacterium]|nr:CocE/NonD family hydrolase [Chloroflexota bacterium]
MAGSVAEYSINVTQDVMVPMRDGVRLAADIYRPTLNGEMAPGNFPTIFGRTSCGKSNTVMRIEAVANLSTPRVYAVVLQDLRGRGRSEGTGQYFRTVNPREGQDGYDTVEWTAAQGRSSGKVGTVGSYHGGKVQTAMAPERPLHLTAMWADVNTVNLFDGRGLWGCDGAPPAHGRGSPASSGASARETERYSRSPSACLGQ